MKRILLILALLPSLLFAQTTGQNSIEKKAATGSTKESFTLSAGQIIGRTAAGTLGGFTLGDGLALTGSTLSATASSASTDLLTANLIHEFRMTDGSGSTITNTGLIGGNMTATSSPLWVTGGLKFTPSNSKASGAVTSVTLYDYAMYAVFNWAAADSAAGAPFMGLFCTNAFDGPRLSASQQSNQGRACSALNNSEVTNGMCSIKDGQWHMLASVRSGGTVTTYLDDIVVATGTRQATSAVTTLQWGLNNGFTVPATVGYMALYNAAHTKAQVRTQRQAFASIMTARGVSMPVLPKIAMLVGDSLMANSSSIFAASASLDQRVAVNRAVAGSMIASGASNMTDDAANVDDYLNAARTKQILCILTGNDMVNGTAADYVALLKTYCLARRAAGWNHIAVCIPGPRVNAGFNAKVAAALALILADTSFYDSLVRIDLDPTIGVAGSELNATYYSDGIHLTTAGMNIQVPLILAGVNAAW